MAQQQHNTLAFSSFAPVASSQIKNSSSVTILPTSSNNSLLYDNCTYGVRFQSPYGWKKVEILASRLTTVEFTSLGRNVSGSYSPHAVVDISIEKGLGNVTTLEQYREAADKLLLATLGNFTTIQSSQGTLSGLPAIERVLAIKQPISGIDIWITQVFTLKNSKAYTVTYTVPASRYIAYSPIVREIINSFQITK